MSWTWWMTLLVIFAALALIGCIPVGGDIRYSPEGFFLSLVLGPVRLQRQKRSSGLQKSRQLRRSERRKKRPPFGLAAWRVRCSCWSLPGMSLATRGVSCG